MRNIILGGSDERVVERNRRRKRTASAFEITQNTLKTIYYWQYYPICSLSVKICKFKKKYKKILKTMRRGHKENSNLEQKLANRNNSFPLCPARFYLSIETQF